MIRGFHRSWRIAQSQQRRQRGSHIGRDAPRTFSMACTAFKFRATTRRLSRSTVAESSESCWRFRESAIAPAVVRAARLYALAMELIESQAEICYQLFISAVETIAGAVLEGWEPDTESKLAAKGGLVSYATKKEGLGREAAERLALEASRGNPWSNRKFKKFLLDNLDRDAIRSEDKLFIVPQEFCPNEDQIEKAIGEVYQTRSGATHAGRSYPATAAIGPLTSVPAKALDAIINMRPSFPPIGWFERIVNNAICNYLRRELVAGTAPKRDQQ